VNFNDGQKIRVPMIFVSFGDGQILKVLVFLCELYDGELVTCIKNQVIAICVYVRHVA
jgi:hypothetical protein